MGNYYRAIVTLDPHEVPLLLGASGWAKIRVDHQPLGLRLYRSVRSTFRLPW